MSLKKITAIILFFFYLTGTCALANTQRAHIYFKKGYILFHSLLKNKRRARYRSNWYRVRDLFLRAYEEDKKGPWAPKSLYYVGRTYYELGLRSHLKRDYERALKYFNALLKHFPSHPWCDDAKLYCAKIELYHLNKRDEAYIDLLYIVEVYPKGDKAPEAERLLKKLDEKYLKKIGYSAISSPHRVSSSSKTPSLTGTSTLKEIRSWSNPDYTRVVLELDRSAPFREFLLPPSRKKGHPFYRVVVDISRTKISPHLDKKMESTPDGGMLHGLRYARHSRGVIRVVMEFKRVGEYKVFSLHEPFRIVVDVFKNREEKKTQVIARGEYVKKNIGKFSANLVEQLGLDIKTIMIDPGHGGKDPGATWGRLKEKDINLELAKILGKMLEKKGFRVLYTRTKDVFIPLEKRTAMANSMGADLFISLHVNAHPNPRVHGIEVYYLNLASSKDAVRVAARENAISSKKISDLQVILTDLMLNSKIKESSALASRVLKGILRGVRRYKMEDNGVKEAPFYVLMGAKMPAILIEIGYITNPGDRRKLTSRRYLTRLARGIVNGILAYRKEIKRFAGL